MNKSKRRSGFLLILWVCFTANLSQRVELFPHQPQVDENGKVEMRTRMLDSLHIPQEIRFLPVSVRHYTAVEVN
ncbi:MAG: hypothetical protein KTR30_04630 [Saprospiraceae bacterium]|nr:hypothetical protein [Saprospiraceae bacterium]